VERDLLQPCSGLLHPYQPAYPARLIHLPSHESPKPPPGELSLHEIKRDGFRIIARVIQNRG
jgi:hypothetical protein